MNWTLGLQVYCLVANIVLVFVMLCFQKNFIEFKNSNEEMRNKSFTEVFFAFVIGAIIYSYTWIISVPLTFIFLL